MTKISPNELSLIIATRGFHHFKNFLSKNETSEILEIYQSLKNSDNKNYPVKVLAINQMPKSVFAKLDLVKDNCFPTIKSEITNAAFFSIDTLDLVNSINSGFHPDHESYYFTGDHTHHLNLYLTIQKDDLKNSNLSLVPADSLKKIDSKFHEIFTGAGASMTVNNTYFSQSKDLAYKFSFDFNSIVETPELQVGDLLLMRGDIIHRTQNQNSNRVALSVRSGRPDVVVDRNRYYPTSLNHLHFIKNNIKPYAKRAFLFSYADLDFMSLQELNTLYLNIGNNYTSEIKELYENFLTRYNEYIEYFSAKEKERLSLLANLRKENLSCSSLKD